MAESKLAAGLPRQPSNNKAEQAQRQRILECTKYIQEAYLNSPEGLRGQAVESLEFNSSHARK